MDLAPPRGTRDFFPEDMRLRSWLFDHFRSVARRFAFEEVDAPVVESEALYVRKSGEEITGQLYNFEDKSGRRLALRPEMTPSIARLVLQRRQSLQLPIRWTSLPQCWRYERTTRGRRREHYQWNMDVFGVPDVTAEAELLAALTTLLADVGLGADDVRIRISHRGILQSVVESAGVPSETFAEVCVLVDKLEKVPRETVEAGLAALGLDPASVERILSTLGIRALDELARVVGADDPAIRDLERLFALAESYGYAPWLEFDASVVRGLAYYTGVVFEAFDRTGELRAIAGGGRYDRLLSTFGGEDLPACGFGFGDVVIVELLREKGKLPDLAPRIDDLVFALEERLRGPAIEIAGRLRSRGRSVDLVLEDKKLKWALRQADRAGATRLVLVAPDEWEKGCVRTKDVGSGEEKEISWTEL